MYRPGGVDWSRPGPARPDVLAAEEELAQSEAGHDPLQAAALELQDRAGNAAVASLVAPAAAETPSAANGAGAQVATVQRQPVGPKSTTKWSGMAGRFETFIGDASKGPFTIQIFALTDDIIGHAWIGVTRGDGEHRTVGFWPDSITAGILGAGKLISADPHEGQEMHKYEEPATFDQLQRLLPVIASWDGTFYSLMGHHCATFAHAAYTTVTGENFDPMFNDSMIMWSPATLGESIDERHRVDEAWKKLKAGGSPQAFNDAVTGGGGDTTAGGDGGTTAGGDGGTSTTGAEGSTSDAGEQVASTNGGADSSSDAASSSTSDTTDTGGLESSQVATVASSTDTTDQEDPSAAA